MKYSFSHCLAAFALVAVTGCLPDQFTDAQIAEKIADASGGDAAGPETVAADQQTAGQTCAPPVAVDGTCDDKNAVICDGCYNCKLRTSLYVHSDQALAAATTVPQLAVDFAKTKFSVEAWVKVEDAPTNGKLAPLVALTRASQVGSIPASGYVVMAATHLLNDTQVGCAVGNVGDNDPMQFAVKAVELGEWHHVRCIWDSKDNRLSLVVDDNDALPSKVNKTGAPTAVASLNALLVGRLVSAEDDGTVPFVGEIDELRILTGAEATHLNNFNYRYSGDEAGLVALYHMDLGQDGKILHDASKNNIDLKQTSKFAGLMTKYQDAALPSLAETCYGYIDKDVNCKSSSAPWCSK